jgi:hypothetical protein
LSATSALGFGCATLFFLPFIAIGVGAIAFAASKLAEGDQTGAVALGFFGLVFGLAGFGGLAAVAAGRRESARRALAEAEHPGEPWRWRADWAAGQVRDTTRSAATGLWGFAVFWNLIALPAAFFGVREAIAKSNAAAWAVLLFPAVGVGLLLAAARASMRSRKFGASRLDLVTVPATVGHGLGGVIRTPADVRPADGFALRFSCVRIRRTGSGKNRSTQETILWQEEKRVSGQRGAGGRDDGLVTNIPVAFRIPADAVPCDDANPNDKVVWRLRAAALVPGVDYASVFEVPVFRTAASDGPVDPDLERLLGPELSAAGWRQPPDSPIRVTRRGSATEILFPAGRNRGAALGLTLFAALWGAVTIVLVVLDAPVGFTIAFSVVEALVVYGVLRLWFRVVLVTADRDRLSVAAGFGAPGEPRTVPAADVTGIELRIGMQSGDRVWYDLRAVRAGGRSLAAGGGIRDKREAEWLAAQLEAALGRSRQPGTAAEPR